MYFSTTLVAVIVPSLLSACFLASATSIPYASSLQDRSSTSSGSCPSIWTTIASDLHRNFQGCQQNTRYAIRFAFHDAAGYSSKNTPYAPASGGADGSLLLSSKEIARPAEAPLQSFRPFLLEKYNQYKSEGISAADLVQFAGSLAIASCPGGPIVKTVVGRTDDAKAAPNGNLPDAFGHGASYGVLINLWADKGFSATDLAALVGAHTVSASFAQEKHGIPPGGSQDTTPSVWDNQYFSQTQDGQAPYSFESDVNLSNATSEAGQAFTNFAQSKSAWDAAFTSAMQRLSVLGIPSEVASGLVDCTSVIEQTVGA